MGRISRYVAPHIKKCFPDGFLIRRLESLVYVKVLRSGGTGYNLRSRKSHPEELVTIVT